MQSASFLGFWEHVQSMNSKTWKFYNRCALLMNRDKFTRDCHAVMASNVESDER